LPQVRNFHKIIEVRKLLFYCDYDMIKITYVIGTLEIGGAEKQLLYLCQNLDKSLFSPIVISLRKGGALKTDFLQNNIPVVEIGKRWKLDPGFFFRLVKVLQNGKPDILHTFMFTANTWGRFAGILVGIKKIITSERCVDIWKRGYHRAVDRFLLKFTDKVIANSKGVEDFYLKTENIPEEKINVIYNGFDIDRISSTAISPGLKKQLGLEKAEFIVGAGGRFTAQKGFIHLLKAVPAVLKVYPGCFFIFVGDGPLRGKFEKFVSLNNLEKNVIFTGYRNDINEIFKLCDVIAVPSFFEGMPNIVIEAMAIAKSVIVSDINEMKEFVKEGITGFFTEPGNERQIAEKLVMLLKDGNLRERAGRNAYNFVKENFALERMVKSYEKIYLNFKVD
jgi:glycosyltransferase involved in cell wall biosynthesis